MAGMGAELSEQNRWCSSLSQWNQKYPKTKEHWPYLGQDAPPGLLITAGHITDSNHSFMLGWKWKVLFIGNWRFLVFSSYMGIKFTPRKLLLTRMLCANVYPKNKDVWNKSIAKVGSCQLRLSPVCPAGWQVNSPSSTGLGNAPLHRQLESPAWKTCHV